MQSSNNKNVAILYLDRFGVERDFDRQLLLHQAFALEVEQEQIVCILLE